VGGYIMLKRIADWLEKVSVAAFAVGVFQDRPVSGSVIAIVSLAISLAITKKIGG
jgi:hypothetical protein